MPTSPKRKVYHGVLQEIREFIEKNNLLPGDKLPSERDLADTLQAGRSSVREALRAMELLGLIVTKQGEGTFLSNYRPYQTVELLSSFILQENSTKNDLMLTKKVLEKEAAKLAFSRINEEEVKDLKLILANSEWKQSEKHVAFFTYVFERTENLLLVKIWQLMEDFSRAMINIYYKDSFYRELIQLYITRSYLSIEALFEHYTTSETDGRK
ncbi:GntR family transcriptional regulator [Virgibacillus sp. C22-A2]|uniref:GntR family transcriptional regulator n=1 Tax=Virgibacillus tibetensis TaxID=3042313 RepID=A0ABU6KAJ4_9BACI|nr:GntR family transcriptional regulator [Virgibacillus sp. C22-A2]